MTTSQIQDEEEVYNNCSFIGIEVIEPPSFFLDHRNHNNCSFIGIEVCVNIVYTCVHLYNNCSFIGIEVLISFLLNLRSSHNNCSFIGIEVSVPSSKQLDNIS